MQAVRAHALGRRPQKRERPLARPEVGQTEELIGETKPARPSAAGPEESERTLECR